MARLSEKQKKAVPKKDRGIPGKSGTGSYPMPDKAHARAALSLLHNAPKSKQAAIRAKANAKLGQSSTKSRARAK